MRFRAVIPVAALAVLALTPAEAQRRQPTPEQRIDRLEKQVRQVQRQVFPKGQPADTAGLVDDPAATQQAVSALVSRIDSVERQLADIVRQAEENAQRVSVLETDLARLRAEQDQRLRAIENNTSGRGDAGEQPADDFEAPPPAPQPKVERSRADAAPTPVALTGNADVDAEAAYDAGYRLWTAGKFDQAIAALNDMAKKYPNHRRVSWAHNLAGRALLDKGQPRAAAEALLANYRRDPKGERAQDSLFYLGQALVKLGQSSQACKAYAELEDVYGGNLRAQLKASLPAAKAQAKCS
ncbi:tetratricopeptide repeat protein [Sphingomonas xanthus]|nr:tetratricopeptide repeat protein [Sphingomonas xanthus]